MKTIILITVLFAACTSYAYSTNYEEVMKTNISKINEMKSSTELTTLANQFQRISNAEKDKWLPGYYAAYCYVASTFYGEMSADDKHKQLDFAQAEIDKLLKTNSKESEIFALQAFIYQIRITDMSKGFKYSSLASEALATAENLNDKNPRVYYLTGSNTFHTPKMFGGGKEKAKPYLEKAAKMFETQKPENELSPNWGKEHNSQLLSQCNEKDKE